MFGWLNGSSRLGRRAEELYGGVVAAARQAVFYGAGRVSDTPEGRLEMIALHLFLLAERLTGEGKDGEALARGVIEAFVTDMDDCMREMGVGDLKVPKQVKQAAALFYKRAKHYRAGVSQALAEPGNMNQLSETLKGVLARDGLSEEFPAALADYAVRLSRRLSSMRFEEISGPRFSLAHLTKMQMKDVSWR